MDQCPGQDTRQWGPESIYEVECRSCGASVEFFKDEVRRRCPKCGDKVLNAQMDLGCAEWCQYAEECVGAKAPPVAVGAASDQGDDTQPG
jgi:DNA-directed RNA polymerase subunit RPC12/RpoP